MQWTFAHDALAKDTCFLHVEQSDTTQTMARGDWLIWDATADLAGLNNVNTNGVRVTKTGEIQSHRTAGVVETLPVNNTTVGNIAATSRVPVFLLQSWGQHDAALVTTDGTHSTTAAISGVIMSATAGRASGTTTAGLTAADAAAICGFSYVVIPINQTNVAFRIHVKCM